ncbi:hypothetical protein MMC11_002646 [Xylographa trunciseda]|nr:hypothetical protein [Xylographa trunciseda]
MPYNTRRKSLSLPSLGIQLPHSSRAHAHRLVTTKPSHPADPQQPPAKRFKRSHTSNTPPPPPPPPAVLGRPRSSTSSSASSKTVTFADRPKNSGRTVYEHTPPPSPGASHDTKIDTDGINDDIVTGVIEQLEKTGNRPHLIKELAAVLSTINDSVAGSANPAALLSSRLAAYLKRSSWSALSPCPLGKELVPIHPRKVYYYLTTLPRQGIPADSTDILSTIHVATIRSGGKGGKRIISPSLSNASVDEDIEAAAERRRDALSPSPEVELFTPELDNRAPGAEDDFPTPPTPAGSSFSGRSSLARDGTNGTSAEVINLVHSNRAQSPPLEGDEREFTQTASSMRMRGMSLDESTIRESRESDTIATADVSIMHTEETEEEKAKKNSEAVATLFGGQHRQQQESALAIMTSPLVKPVVGHIARETIKGTTDVDMEDSVSILGEHGFTFNWDIKRPENVDLDELDDLFGGF